MILSTMINFWHILVIISAWAIMLMNSYLSDRTQCVKINEILSETTKLTCGVPQRSVPWILAILHLHAADRYYYAITQNTISHICKWHTNLHFILFKTPICFYNKLKTCIFYVRAWMINNKLKLNDRKMEFLKLK